MNPTDALAGLMAGGILLIFLSLALSLGILALFLSALISCLRHQHDKDRLTWVLVIIFVPIIGPILYFTMARRAPLMPPPFPAANPGASAAPPVAYPANPDFDHIAIHDEKMRAAAINKSLSAMGKTARKS